MAEKALTKRDLEQTFKGFEKRQDEKMKNLEKRVVDQFHIISEGLIDQIKLLAEGHAGIIDRLIRMEKKTSDNIGRPDPLSSYLSPNLTGDSPILKCK